MSGAKTGSAFLIAMVAAMVLPCAGIAQMQQSGTQESTGTTPSLTDATATSTTAGPTGASSGASSWTTRKDSFGITGKTPSKSSMGATGGSWWAGGGSFGMRAQPGGIWYDSGGGSMGTPGTAPTQIPVAEGFAPAALPGLPAEVPATASTPGGARSRGIPASRSMAGGHPGSGTHFAVSSGSHPGGSRSVSSKQTSLGARGHAGPSRGLGLGSSSGHAKPPAPSVFAPLGSSTMGGTPPPGSTHETIP